MKEARVNLPRWQRQCEKHLFDLDQCPPGGGCTVDNCGGLCDAIGRRDRSREPPDEWGGGGPWGDVDGGDAA